MLPASTTPTSAFRDTASARRRGRLLMLVSAVSFTANILLIRALGGVNGVPASVLVAARFLVGLIVVYALFAPRGELRLGNLVTRRALIVRGVLGGAATYGFYLTVPVLGAGRAVFIGNTYVLFASLLAVGLLGEAFTRRHLAGAVVSFLGLALLTRAFERGFGLGLYDALAILTAIASGWIVVIIRQLHATEHTSTIFASQCVYGLAVAVAPAAWQSSATWLASPGLVVGLTVAGVAAAAGQLMMTRAYRDLPVAEGSLLQMLVPVGTAVGGVLLFGERLTWGETLGGGLVLVGAALTLQGLPGIKKPPTTSGTGRGAQTGPRSG